MTDIVINKTMDRRDLYSSDAIPIIAELNSLIRALQTRGLAVSSWYGTFDLPRGSVTVERANRGFGYAPLEDAADDRLFPWFLYWEIVWVALHAQFQQGQSVLDLGGSSSLFSFYLALLGCRVVTVDLQRNLVENANHVAGEMGWDLQNFVMDMRALSFDQTFDHVTSICVFEHLRPKDRMASVSRVRNFLRPGGRFSITFDYRNPARPMRIQSSQDVEDQFVRHSGLRVRGNPVFADDGRNYLLQPFYLRQPLRFWKYKAYSILHGHFPIWEFLRTKQANDYTFGALFLEKATGQP